jgi:hypothetical protein
MKFKKEIEVREPVDAVSRISLISDRKAHNMHVLRRSEVHEAKMVVIGVGHDGVRMWRGVAPTIGCQPQVGLEWESAARYCLRWRCCDSVQTSWGRIRCSVPNLRFSTASPRTGQTSREFPYAHAYLAWRRNHGVRVPKDWGRCSGGWDCRLTQTLEQLGIAKKG